MKGFDLPNLTERNHEISSPVEHHHNCLSYAVHQEWIRIWPDDDGRWPLTIPRTNRIEAFVKFFKACKFEELPLTHTHYEPGHEKIAIFVKDGECEHVARQAPDGRWKSKLGNLVDITHEDLRSIEGGQYGSVVKVMRRIDSGHPPELPPLFPPPPTIIIP